MLRTLISKSAEILYALPRSFLNAPKSTKYCESALGAFGNRYEASKIESKISAKKIDWDSFPATSGEIFGCGSKDPELIKALLGKDYELFIQNSEISQ